MALVGMLRLSVFSVALAALPAFAQAQTSEPTPPLSFEEADGLTDRALVERLFAQINDQVVEVRRPPNVPDPYGRIGASFYVVGLSLRPRASGMDGVCAMEELSIALRRDGADAGVTDSRNMPAPFARSRAPAPVDPPMRAYSIEVQESYRLLEDGEASCPSPTGPEDYFSAPNAMAAASAGLYVDAIREAVAAGEPAFEVTCDPSAPDCRQRLALFSRDGIVGVGACGDYHPDYLSIPEGQGCSSFAIAGSRDHRGGSHTSVDVVGNVVCAPECSAQISRLLISNRIIVYD